MNVWKVGIAAWLGLMVLTLAMPVEAQKGATAGLVSAPLPAGPGKVGIFRQGIWSLELNGNGRWDGWPTDGFLFFGLPGDIPIAGDWNGDGLTKIGVFRDGFFLLDYNGNGIWEGHRIDRGYAFGLSGDTPIAGDWNGDGVSKIGVFRNGLFFLDFNGNGVWEGYLTDRGHYDFGLPGDIPIAGDWNGDGVSKIGVFRVGGSREGIFYVDYNGNGQWDGNYDGNTCWECYWYDRQYWFGKSGDRPVIGDWKGDGFSKIAVFRDGFFFLDSNGNGHWDGWLVDQYFEFGTVGDKPVAGSGWMPPDVPIVAPKAVVLNASLVAPWGLAFLPDGRMLVTQKGGSMVILAADGLTVQATVSGLPAVEASDQGGLLDVALDPDFATNPRVYWTYVEPGTGSEVGLSGTVVASGRLIGNAMQNAAVIYRQLPKVSGAGHFGSRLAFSGDKTLFVALGDRQLQDSVQSGTNTLGKVVRINRDGTRPPGNPYIEGFRKEIWSYGHRNPQGAAIRPATGELWINEHGPQGGDELNRIVWGNNYGWPLVSYGCNDGDPVGDACRIGGGTHSPNFIEPASYWVPTSIAPSGLMFYTGSGFPQWHGHVFMGALAGTALWRIELSGNREVARERLFAELGERIRDLRQGPDGWIYLLTDSGKLIQIRD